MAIFSAFVNRDAFDDSAEGGRRASISSHEITHKTKTKNENDCVFQPMRRRGKRLVIEYAVILYRHTLTEASPVSLKAWAI